MTEVPSDVFPVGFSCNIATNENEAISDLVKQSGAIGAVVEKIHSNFFKVLVYTRNVASICKSGVTWIKDHEMYRQDARAAADILFDDIIEW